MKVITAYLATAYFMVAFYSDFIQGLHLIIADIAKLWGMF